MNKLLVCLALFAPFCSKAQQFDSLSNSQTLYAEGFHYLKGIGRSYSPVKALQMFQRSAAAGNGAAMNALGNIYASGTGVNPDINTAISWYIKAGNAKNTKAYYNLGELYRKGLTVPQDFSVAAEYYLSGANLGDDKCKNWLAYLYYKGFGVTQSYVKAFALYQELATNGDINAMYFLGKCYRNGYGVPADASLAVQWLTRSAKGGEKQAIHELNDEPLPDNAYVYNPDLQRQVERLQSYTENMLTSGSNDLGGTYSGYAVYYDFSGKYALDVVPLVLTIKKNNGEYTGTWKESDTLVASIKASFAGNTFIFDSSCRYTRYNHYSNRTGEPYVFNAADLNIKYLSDSMYLTGDIQFYSVLRHEPGEPMFISLSKKIEPTADSTEASPFRLIISPNPATSQVVAHLTLASNSKIRFEILDISGRSLQRTSGEIVPQGEYSYPFNVGALPPGTYVLKVSDESKVESKLFVKL